MMRIAASDAPPGGKPMISVMGWLGDQACATAGRAGAALVRPVNRVRRLMP